jgi:hypothetical protein
LNPNSVQHLSARSHQRWLWRRLGKQREVGEGVGESSRSFGLSCPRDDRLRRRSDGRRPLPPRSWCSTKVESDRKDADPESCLILDAWQTGIPTPKQ